MEKETYDKLAEISAISGITIEELKMAYNAHDPSLDKCLTKLEQRVELSKALDSFYIAVGNTLFADRVIDWLGDKLTKIERWWKRNR